MWDAAVTQDVPLYQRYSRISGPRLEGRQTALQRRTSRPVRRRRADGQRLLWGLVWTCFIMAFLLGSATIVITYLALR
jgi:hypothetical protein